MEIFAALEEAGAPPFCKTKPTSISQWNNRNVFVSGIGKTLNEKHML